MNGRGDIEQNQIPSPDPEPPLDQEQHVSLAPDQPLEDPTEDVLGYAPFARHLAGAIADLPAGRGMVLAIYGPWGSGKTTVVNFVRYHLSQNADDLTVIYFNPWWFSTPEYLTRHFFDTLISALRSRKVLTGSLRNRLRTLADQMTSAPGGVGLIARLTSFFRPASWDVNEVKGAVSRALIKSQRRVLIVIDDIDRLADEETRELFRVIKTGADFQNTSYLLAFDKQVVVTALQGVQGEKGEEYLAKIVQVPFELPIPERSALRQLFTEKLDLLLTDTPSELFDSDRWRSAFIDGIDELIRTPRDVIRLTNSLAATYPSVKGEVNFVDFVGMEAVKVFASEAYDFVRSNQTRFAGSVQTSFGGSDVVDELRNFHHAWLSALDSPHRESLKHLLSELFPKFKAALGDPMPASGLESGWRRQLRVASNDVFPVYFRLAPPVGQITATEVRAFLEMPPDAVRYAEVLLALAEDVRSDGSTRASALLERLIDYFEEGAQPAQAASMIRALFRVADHLLERDQGQYGIFGFDIETHIGRVLSRALRILEPSQRKQILQTAAGADPSLAMLTHELAVLGREHGRYGGDRTAPPGGELVTAEDLDTLEATMVERIRRAGEDGSLLTTPHLSRVLYMWKALAGDEEPSNWVSMLIGRDEGVVLLLRAFDQRTRSVTVGNGGRVREQRWIDPKAIEPFIAPSGIRNEVLRLLARADTTGSDREVLQRFIVGYEAREEGRDPAEEEE